jgi:hypothetical protein
MFFFAGAREREEVLVGRRKRLPHLSGRICLWWGRRFRLPTVASCSRAPIGLLNQLLLAEPIDQDVAEKAGVVGEL